MLKLVCDIGTSRDDKHIAQQDACPKHETLYSESILRMQA